MAWTVIVGALAVSLCLPPADVAADLRALPDNPSATAPGSEIGWSEAGPPTAIATADRQTPHAPDELSSPAASRIVSAAMVAEAIAQLPGQHQLIAAPLVSVETDEAAAVARVLGSDVDTRTASEGQPDISTDPTPTAAVAEQPSGSATDDPSATPLTDVMSERELITQIPQQITTVTVPRDPRAGVRIADDDGAQITIRLPHADAAARAVRLDSGAIVYPGDQESANAVIPTQSAVQMLTTITGEEAPVRYTYQLDLPEGAHISLVADGAELIQDDGSIMAVVLAPWARDAKGMSIPTHFETDGHTLTQVIAHDSLANVAYPVTADPFWSFVTKLIGSAIKVVTKAVLPAVATIFKDVDPLAALVAEMVGGCIGSIGGSIESGASVGGYFLGCVKNAGTSAFKVIPGVGECISAGLNDLDHFGRACAIGAATGSVKNNVTSGISDPYVKSLAGTSLQWAATQGLNSMIDVSRVISCNPTSKKCSTPRCGSASQGSSSWLCPPARPLTMTGTQIVGPGSSQSCLQGEQNARVRGAIVDFRDCNGTSEQSWSRWSDGTLRANGLCLDIVGNSTALGAAVQLWDCNGSGGQSWLLGADGSLVNPQSQRCLDDPNGNAPAGTQLRVWDCNRSDAQRWSLKSMRFTVTGPGAACLDDDTNTARNGNLVQLWECNGVPGQQWTSLNDGALRSYDLCMSVVDSSRTRGARIELRECRHLPSQQWVLRDDSSLMNPASSLCLDSPDGSALSGTRLRLWDCNGSAAQRWQFHNG